MLGVPNMLNSERRSSLITTKRRENPLDINQNQSSSINNWLDDQLKKERRVQGRKRSISDHVIQKEGREN